MKKGAFLAILMLGFTVLGGCGGTTGKMVTRETQDPYFRPKRVYAVDMNQAWDLTLKALNREGISLETVNQEMGVMRTDYQNLSAWERNKCDIRFSPEPQRKTYIYIRCRYEGRKDAAEPFRDFTYSSPREAMKAEEDLYRRIEPYILPFEKTFLPREAAVDKAPAAVAPAPAAEKPVSKVEAAAPPVTPPAAAPPAPAPRVETVSPPSPPTVAPPAPPPAEKPEIREETLPQREETLPKREETLFGPVMTAAATNVRLAPSIQSKIITVLPKGERAEKIGESGNWSKIKLPSGMDAWVFTDFLEPASAAPSPVPAAPTVEAPPVKPETPPPPPVAKVAKPAGKSAEGPAKDFFVTKKIARMRAEPNLKSKVVLVLKKGRKVEKLEESGEFVKVRLSWGDSGWVQKRLLEPAP
jgi:SH3-like domain-containing protein